MEMPELISADSRVLNGKAVVSGTRITVQLILEKLGAGESIEQILDAHPKLTRDSVLAALRFAHKFIEEMEDDSPDELDFDWSNARPNPYAGKIAHCTMMTIYPEVAAVFKSSDDVNAMLRAIIDAMPTQ